MKITIFGLFGLGPLAFLLMTPLTANAQEPQVKIETTPLVDFSEQNERSHWMVVNDNVMGGRSKGSFKIENSKLIFSGSTNTRGGGFSSIRTKPQKWATEEVEGLVVKVRGDGRTYKADLLTDNKMRGIPIAYRADFKTKKNVWMEVQIPFDSFTPTLFGSSIQGRTKKLDRKKIETIGFMIYDKKDGPFQLEVDWVKTFKTSATKDDDD